MPWYNKNYDFHVHWIIVLLSAVIWCICDISVCIPLNLFSLDYWPSLLLTFMNKLKTWIAQVIFACLCNAKRPMFMFKRRLFKWQHLNDFKHVMHILWTEMGSFNLLRTHCVVCFPPHSVWWASVGFCNRTTLQFWP